MGLAKWVGCHVPCGPNKSYSLACKGSHRCGYHEMFSSSIYHKSHWLATFHHDHRLPGAQDQGSWSPLVWFCSSQANKVLNAWLRLVPFFAGSTEHLWPFRCPSAMGTHSSSVWSLCNRCTGSGIVVVSSWFPLFTREQSVSLDLNYTMLLLAGLFSVSLFFLICFSLGFTVSVHKDFICHFQELCGIHPSEAFQLLELSLDVCTGLSHKGSIIICWFSVVSGSTWVYVQNASHSLS